MENLIEKYKDRILGVLNCYDRIVLTGTIAGFCYAEGMTAYLYSQHIKIFDYQKFVQPLRNLIRDNAEEIARKQQLTIENIRKKNFRKEDRIREILKKRGTHSGLVHIFSAMEPCTSYKPWYDKNTGRAYLKYDDGKCLHYYFYFIDAELGLCYLRVPTWCPFRLQFYFNGHGHLGCLLSKKGIAFQRKDNAFVQIDNFNRANELAFNIDLRRIHAMLDRIAAQYCPVLKALDIACHWSLMQVEYATDIVFKTRQDLQAIYPYLLETLIHSVKPENIATFLEHRLLGSSKREVTTKLDRHVVGTRIKYQMGPVSIKMYDKFGSILRIEVTVNDVSFFKQYRTVQHKDGNSEKKWTKMRKTIYSLHDLAQQLGAANRRYLEFLSQIQTPQAGVKMLNEFTVSKVENDHRYSGFNLLSTDDSFLLRLLLRGEFVISGFNNAALRSYIPNANSGKISRLLKRLRVHGLVRKIGHHYKYYLTRIGIQVATAALKLRELFLIPFLAGMSAPCFLRPVSTAKKAKTQR
jgi:hypothetical protein